MTCTSASFYIKQENLDYINEKVSKKSRYNKSNWLDDLVDHLRKKDKSQECHKESVTEIGLDKSRVDKIRDTNSELIEDGFNHWWGLYPSKKRVDKKGCSRKWKSKCKPLSEDQIIDLINSLSADIVKKAKEVEHLKFMPQTTTYLNQERWNDGE
jgi:hypothetical protein